MKKEKHNVCDLLILQYFIRTNFNFDVAMFHRANVHRFICPKNRSTFQCQMRVAGQGKGKEPPRTGPSRTCPVFVVFIFYIGIIIISFSFKKLTSCVVNAANELKCFKRKNIFTCFIDQKLTKNAKDWVSISCLHVKITDVRIETYEYRKNQQNYTLIYL